MCTTDIILAAEDAVCECLILKTIDEIAPHLNVCNRLPMRGAGYIKQKIKSLNESARSCPIVVVTDLDQLPCPTALIGAWLGSYEIAQHLLINIAIRESEAWVLADKQRFAEFLGIRANRIPNNTEEIIDPKSFVLSLARKSRRRSLKLDLLPRDNSTATVGPDYNGTICGFVRQSWSCVDACQHSPSLARAVDRLRDFEVQSA